MSTLDLAGSGRFTVLTGIGGDAWRVAAARLSSELGIEVAVVGIGAGQEVDDATFDWAAVRDIADDGCLLVRPDQHIAYRSRTAHPDAEAQLEAAILRALGRE